MHVRSRDGAQDQENAPMSPDAFPRERLGRGLGTRLRLSSRIVRVTRGRRWLSHVAAPRRVVMTSYILPSCSSLVPRPQPLTRKRVWGHWRRNHVIICIAFLLAHVRSRDGAQDQENAPMSPDPFPRERLGSGNETTHAHAHMRRGLVQNVDSGLWTGFMDWTVD